MTRDEFRMQPTGWTKPVTLDEMITETAREIGLGRDMYAYATDEDDLEDARKIITAAREFERERILAILRSQRDDLRRSDAAYYTIDNLSFAIEQIEKE